MRSRIPLLILFAAFAAQASAAPTVHSLRAGDSKLTEEATSPLSESAQAGVLPVPFQTTREATLLPDGRIEMRCGQVPTELQDFRYRSVDVAEGDSEEEQQ